MKIKWLSVYKADPIELEVAVDETFSTEQQLEQIFAACNRLCSGDLLIPNDQPSMMTGDLVWIGDEVWYCDQVGWKCVALELVDRYLKKSIEERFTMTLFDEEVSQGESTESLPDSYEAAIAELLTLRKENEELTKKNISLCNQNGLLLIEKHDLLNLIPNKEV